MRIAIWHNLPSGGGKRALYQQVAGLRARGHTLEAWCPAYADPDYLPLNTLIPEHVLPCPPLHWPTDARPGSLTRQIRGQRQTQALQRSLQAHARASAAAIAAGGFEVLLAGPCQYQLAPPIGRYLKLPKVLYLQEPNRRLYEANPRWPWAAAERPAGWWRSPRQLYRGLIEAARVQMLRGRARDELANVLAFDRVLVNSLFSRESLLRVYGLEARVCYLGVDAAQFRPSGAAREGFVMGLGALHANKRVDLAIRAVGTLPPAERPALVWIANFSQPAYQQAMEQLAAACGVTLTVRVGLSDAAVVDWLSRAAVLIYAPRLEPFGLAALEANACETPVVAVAEGGLRETISAEVNGVLVHSAEPAALGAALRRVLADPAWARSLGVAGRQQVVERWPWERSIEQLERELREVAGQSGK